MYLLFLVYVCVSMLASCFGIPLENETMPLSAVGDALNLDISSGTIVHNRDSHGGWLGDGEVIVVVSFSPENAPLTQIETTWTPLPLTENLNTAVYGNYKDNYRRNPFFTDEKGNPFLPEIENGYYFFRDRSSESTDHFDDSELFNRASYNFTLAIYDTDTQTLYYFELDT